MSVEDLAVREPHLSLVDPNHVGKADAGRAFVFGPFPPLINAAAGHASSILHLFKSSGFEIRSGTGPGMALALHKVSFKSETQLRESTEFINDAYGSEFAVIYAKSLDFDRVNRPYWYKRRLEELRRLRFLWRVLGTFETTMIVYDERPFFSRYQLSIWATSKLASIARRRRILSVNQNVPNEVLFEKLTGRKKPAPPAYLAEDTAYNAAFRGTRSAPKVRLTAVRVQQAIRFWAARNKSEEAEHTSRDVQALLKVVLKHDLKHLPQFALLWDASSVDQSMSLSRMNAVAFNAADEAVSEAKETGVPITRYMKHLAQTVHPSGPLSIQTKSDAEKLLEWYVTEAHHHVPKRQVPLPSKILQYYVSEIVGQSFPDVSHVDSDVTHTLGRDKKPFVLSKPLASLFKSSEDFQRRYSIEDPTDRIGFVVEVILRSAGQFSGLDFLGPSASEFFQNPIGDDPHNISRIDLIIAMQTRFELEDRSGIETPWAFKPISEWVNEDATTIFPTLLELSKPRTPVAPLRNHLTLTGLPKSETGVGSNLHMSLAAFQKIGLNPDVRDAADNMRKLECEQSKSFGPRLKKPVVIHHVNADQIPQFVLASPRQAHRPAYHIGFLLWEFDVLPESHQLALDLLDEIWTPTEFLKRIYEKHTNKPVHNVMKGLHIPEVQKTDLTRFGVPRGSTVFLTCFDFHSSVSRKNPLAAVRAFQKAFPKREGPEHLIVKTTPINNQHWGDPEGQMRQIQNLARKDPRIHVIAEYFAFNELLSLISSCDCLISPHRAEGFGLMPAYALGLRTPVMATNYSGTTDFCTEDTASLIPYELVEVQKRHVQQPLKSATWAEIDATALAVEMARFGADQTAAKQKAEAGYKLITSKFSPLNQANRYAERLKAAEVI